MPIISHLPQSKYFHVNVLEPKNKKKMLRKKKIVSLFRNQKWYIVLLIKWHVYYYLFFFPRRICFRPAPIPPVIKNRTTVASIFLVNSERKKNIKNETGIYIVFGYCTHKHLSFLYVFRHLRYIFFFFFLLHFISVLQPAASPFRIRGVAKNTKHFNEVFFYDLFGLVIRKLRGKIKYTWIHVYKSSGSIYFYYIFLLLFIFLSLCALFNFN